MGEGRGTMTILTEKKKHFIKSNVMRGERTMEGGKGDGHM